MVVPRLAWLLAFSSVQGFSPSSIFPSDSLIISRDERNTFRSYFRLRAANDDDLDEEDDEGVDDAALADWRKFRASLVDSGLPTKEEDGLNLGEQQPGENGREKTQKKKKAVAEANKELLAKQNEKLAKEYEQELWAHSVVGPEVGGLLCRLPIEAQLFWGGQGYWKERLATELSLGFGTVHFPAADEDIDEEDAKWQSKVAW